MIELENKSKHYQLPMKKLMVIVGEASADLHAGKVLEELADIRSDVELVGTGGKRLKNLGAKLFYKIEELHVVGFWEVMKKYSYFKNILSDMVSKLDTEKPDAVFLVDYPGFNIRFAEEAHKRGIKVIYYIAPQVWQWKKKRIFKIKRVVDHMVALFPFEVGFFKKEADMDIECFGHPLIDIAKPSLPKAEVFEKWGFDPDKKLVSLLPGSRGHEVANHLQTLLQMAEYIGSKRDDIQFAFPMAQTVNKEDIQPLVDQLSVKVTLVEDDTYNVVGHSDFATVASGTATLETAVMETPMIIFYKTSPLTFFLGTKILKMDTVGLPNIVAGRHIVPEMLQHEFTPEKLGERVMSILDNSEEYGKIKQDLADLKMNLGESGAYKKTAEYLSSLL